MSLRSLLATLLCASALTACAATQASDPLGGSCETFQATKSVEQSAALTAGSDARIFLCSNPSTGFSWGEPRVGDASVLQVVDRAFQAPGAASNPIVGAAGGEVLLVRGLKTGTTTLSLGYGQPWAAGTKDEWTYTLSVTVR
jgi:predicted secreted protein